MKKELTEEEVAFIRRALKHFQNWLGSGEEPVSDNLPGIRGKPHGADAPPQPNGQKTMAKEVEGRLLFDEHLLQHPQRVFGNETS